MTQLTPQMHFQRVSFVRRDSKTLHQRRAGGRIHALTSGNNTQLSTGIKYTGGIPGFSVLIREDFLVCGLGHGGTTLDLGGVFRIVLF
jgi:hypothetical protein